MSELKESAKAIQKFSDVTYKVSELIFGPKYIVRRGRAKAEETANISQATREATVREGAVDARAILGKRLATSEIDPLEYRMLSRLIETEMQRQLNLESIANGAFQTLSDGVDYHVPESDWVYQFRDYSQDVSDREMQDLWSRLLAGEIQHMGSFSPPTMWALRHMTKAEAELLRKFCGFVWSVGKWNCVYLGREYRSKETGEHSSQFGLTGGQLARLRWYGIVAENQHPGTVIGLSRSSPTVARYGSRFFRVKPAKIRKDTHPALSVTGLGIELYRLVGHTPSKDHLNHILNSWEQYGFSVSEISLNDYAEMQEKAPQDRKRTESKDN